MKYFLLLISLLFFALPARATWALVQHPSTTGCNGTTCAVTVTSTGAGHLLVFAALIGNTTSTLSSVSGDGTWTVCGASCRSVSSVTTTEMGYILSATGGATTITGTLSATSPWSAAVLEYSYTSGPISVDAQGHREQTTGTTSCAGVTLTLTGTNDVIVQIANPSGSISAVTSPYTSPADFPGGNGVAGSINTTSGTAPTWTQTSSTDALSAIAFKETASGAVPGVNKRQKIESMDNGSMAQFDVM